MTQDDLIKQTTKFRKFDKSISCADEIMKIQKSPLDKTGLGFTKVETSQSQVKSNEKSQETNKSSSAGRGPGGTFRMVPPVAAQGSARPAVDTKVGRSLFGVRLSYQ